MLPERIMKGSPSRMKQSCSIVNMGAAVAVLATVSRARPSASMCSVMSVSQQHATLRARRPGQTEVC